MTIRSLIPTLLIASAVAPLAAADVYELDGAHSAALFAVSHMGIGETWGRFNEITGSITIDAADPTKNAVAVTIKTGTVDTANAKRDEHLRAIDFFNAKQYPDMTFASSGWKVTGPTTADVTGTLTIRGVAKTITVPVTKVGEGKNLFNQAPTVGYKATFTVKRTEFGMTGVPVAVVGDDVAITVALEAAKAAAK